MAYPSDVEESLSAYAANMSDESSDELLALETNLGGPDAVVGALISKLWLPQKDRNNSPLLVLVHLVESYPKKYMSLAASAVRRDIAIKFDVTKTTESSGDGQKIISYAGSDALLLALAKLLIAPDSDTQTGIATDAHDALLILCKWDNHEYHKSNTCQKLFQHLAILWEYLQKQQKDMLRESSTAQMRIAALMVDVCLVGGKEMALALSDDAGNVMNKLLHLALDYPNEDPLLQMTALDTLEGLAARRNDCPMTSERGGFLLGNDKLHGGLLYLLGSSNDDVEFDPINGYAALRLLTEICRVGMSCSNSIAEAAKFQSLLTNLYRVLRILDPHGESERVSYVHAVSSLIASCAISFDEVSKSIIQDTAFLHSWLSLLSRFSQPKLKSVVLSSLSQVIEPGIWREEDASLRPNDYITLSLYHAFGESNNQKDPTECLLKSAKSPFVEERLGAYTVLRAMVSRGCGVRMLLLHKQDNGNSIFVEWLLNHENEITYEGRKAKYEIVNSLLTCDNNIIEGLISSKAFREMQLWMKRGPLTVVSCSVGHGH